MAHSGSRDRVSVIIPTFNYGHFIEQCVQSVINQNYDECEIIVVDDGSTDDTQNVLKSYSSEINYVYQDNRGLSSARNTGISCATGEYIQFLDSDDLLGENALKGRVQFLKTHSDQSLVICTNRLFRRSDENGKPKCKGKWQLYKSNFPTHLCRANIAPPHAFLMHRRVVEAVGAFDESLAACEDYDYWLRAVTKGFCPVFCPQGEVYYRVHRTSMSANRSHQVEYDAELHFRLFRILFIEKSYPMTNSVSSALAFLTGCANTLSRLMEMDSHSLRSKKLLELFMSAISSTEDILNTTSEKKDSTVSLYSVWLSWKLKSDTKLGRLVSDDGLLARLLAECTNTTALLPSIVRSLARGENYWLETKRLTQVSMAVRMPKIATKLNYK